MFKMTKWSNPNEIITTQYGRITIRKWLTKEKKRLLKLGVDTEIRKDKKKKINGAICIALFREGRYYNQTTNNHLYKKDWREE